MYLLGIDVSKWQGLMNWLKAKLAGAKFAIIRAGSINYVTGIPYTDFQFERNAEEAPEHFDHLGFYWFWRANQDPIVQAEYFSNLLQYKTYDIPPVADVEANNNVNPSTLTTKLKRFLDEVERRTLVRPMIYTRASFWNIATTKPDWALAYDLWCARYKASLTSPWSDGKFKCYPWANDFNEGWEYWQYSADGNGLGDEYGAESDDIDLNYKRLPFSNIPTPPSELEARVAKNEQDILELKQQLEEVQGWIRSYE